MYLLTMKDDAGDGWWKKSRLMIEIADDILVLKYTMTEPLQEYINFSLYFPVMKNEEWKYSRVFESGWNLATFNDNEWTSVICGSTTEKTEGTQYFRKVFRGVMGMAAIDAQFKYAHGVVAYVNGMEIFRDNMPEGEVLPETMASGSYSTADYRGVIHPASIAHYSRSILGVELHFTDSVSRIIDFNAFLSFKAGISPNDNCFKYYDDAGDAVSIGNNEEERLHFRSTSISTLQNPSLYIAFNSGAYPIINAIRIWRSVLPMPLRLREVSRLLLPNGLLSSTILER